ncbi:MAG: hypothetical protein ACK4UN_17870 [Limisphaerales bacterium]
MQRDNPQIATQDPTSQETWNDFPESPPGGQQQGGKTEQIAQGVKEAGAETMRRTKQEGEAIFQEQKHHVAETMHHCCDALRGAARELREKNDANIASFAETIAERLDKTSNYLDGKQLQEIRNDVENFARQQPHIFYGGMFVAGLALSRFFKASQSPEIQSSGAEEIIPS